LDCLGLDECAVFPGLHRLAVAVSGSGYACLLEDGGRNSAGQNQTTGIVNEPLLIFVSIDVVLLRFSRGLA
jgi:hypothetical protein